MPTPKSKTRRSRSRHKLEHVARARAQAAQTEAGGQPKLARYQMAELRKLARDRGTSVAVELSNAVDAYVLGIAPTDIGRLEDMLAKLSASTGEAKITVEEALAVAKKAKRTHRRKGQAARNRKKR
jgi:hypothetical protein